MSFARIQAYLGLDISHFRAGLEKANADAGRFRKMLGGMGAGNLAGFVGVGALVAGFTRVLRSAQEARDAAHEMGKSLSISTLATARMADGLDDAAERLKQGATIMTGLYGQVMNWVAVKTGVGSSFEDQDALQRAERGGAENQKHLDENAARLTREKASAEGELAKAIKARKDAQNDTSDKARLDRLEGESDALREKAAAMPEGSLPRIRAEAELNRLLTERITLQRQLDATRPKSPFEVSLSDAATMRQPGRRSERERLAADAQRHLERGRRAESAGNFSLAKLEKQAAAKIARSAGFGSLVSDAKLLGDAPADMVRHGQSWDDRWAPALMARNSAIQAFYGGAYKRPDSFEQRDRAKSEEGGQVLKEAAEALRDAAEQLKNVEVEVTT